MGSVCMDVEWDVGSISVCRGGGGGGGERGTSVRQKSASSPRSMSPSLNTVRVIIVMRTR